MPVFFARGDQGFPGYWTTLYTRAMASDPAGVAVSSPFVIGDDNAAFRHADTLGHRKCIFGTVSIHGPRAHAPTHRRCRYRHRRKARYRPAGLGVGRAGLIPLGDQPNFQSSSPFLRTSSAWSHPHLAAPQLDLRCGDGATSAHGIEAAGVALATSSIMGTCVA